MINLDTRLLNSKEINSDEFWVLMHIAKRINTKRTCFPNNATLANDTDFGIEKIMRIKKSLVAKKIISCEQRRVKGVFTSNIYTINTKFISIFVNLNEGKYEEEKDGENENTDKVNHRNGKEPKRQTTDTVETDNKVLAKEKEVLAKEKEVLNIAQNKFERLSLSDSNSLAEIKETNSTAKQKKDYTADFETFCEAYPNKLGKSKSEQKFAAAVKKIGFENLMLCVENYKQHVESERKKGFTTLQYMQVSRFVNKDYEDFFPNIEKQQEIDNSPKYKGISLAATVKVVIQGGAGSDVEFGKFLANCVRYQNNLHNYTYNGGNKIALNEIAEIKDLLQNTKYFK